MYFIGISGPIASGKSTLAGYIHENIPHSRIVPFASGVKKLAALYKSESALYDIALYFESLGVPSFTSVKAAWMIMDAFDKYPTEPGRKNRRLLQYIGTEVGREYVDQDIWIKAVRTDVFINGDPHTDVVICDDLRFSNEAEFVDFHIAIDVESTPELSARYIQRIQTLPKEYIYSDHLSEQQQLPVADYMIPVGFSNEDILGLLFAINEKRMGGDKS